jgi:NADH dehydrogenase
MPADSMKRVIILGGGFGGVYTAMHLASLNKRRKDLEIVLVNRENYFVFQPLLPEIISGNIGILDTVSPIHRLVPDAQLYVREVQGIDLAAKTVTLSPGFRPRETVLPYDHLVLALGTVTDFRGSPGLFEHALPFKNLADALRLRNHLIHVLEEASIERDPVLRKQLLTFVVAGGGWSGVEVVAELNDFVRGCCRQYRTLNAKEIEVMLVHSGERILEREVTEGLGRYAQRILEKRGVKMLMKKRLASASPESAILADGTRIQTRTLISTVPSSPHPLLETLDLPKERGKILCDGHMQVLESDHVWAAGDCALIPSVGDGKPCPPTAQHAVRQAKMLAHNICARIDNRPRKTFDFTGLGKLGALGSRRAVAELAGGIKLSGILAWFMWRTIYWMKLPGIDRKIKLGASWALDFLLPPDMVQLKTGGSKGVSQIHYEAGDEVFHQGDMGDALYIITSGGVEVVVSDASGERVVAQMAAGEFFGELALLQHKARTASVRCTQPTTLLALPKADFQALAMSLPQLRTDFDRVAATRRDMPALANLQDEV